MLPHASWPEPDEALYSRAAVQRYLDEADAARIHLEAAVDVAHQRRRLLQSDLVAIVERNARLTRELADTAREIRSDRQSQANAVVVILAAAEAEVAARLARAHGEAAAIRAAAGPRPVAPDDLATPLVLVGWTAGGSRSTHPSRLVG